MDSEKLSELKEMARKYYFGVTSAVVLSCDKFYKWSGSASKDHHHYGDGGLLRHTWEVTKIAMESNKLLGYPADERLLFLACIFHDIGKVFDYEVNEDGQWVSNQHKKKVGHLSRSALIWMETANRYNFNVEDSETVLHGILAHHGMREWGSPVTPQTPLAWILHTADTMSARVDESRNFKS